jgi:hypothetical protein
MQANTREAQTSALVENAEDPSIRAQAYRMNKEATEQAEAAMVEFQIANTQTKIAGVVSPEQYEELSTASEEQREQILTEITQNPEIQQIYREYAENIDSLRRQ